MNWGHENINQMIVKFPSAFVSIQEDSFRCVCYTLKCHFNDTLTFYRNKTNLYQFNWGFIILDVTGFSWLSG